MKCSITKKDPYAICLQEIPHTSLKSEQFCFSVCQYSLLFFYTFQLCDNYADVQSALGPSLSTYDIKHLFGFLLKNTSTCIISQRKGEKGQRN